MTSSLLPTRLLPANHADACLSSDLNNGGDLLKDAAKRFPSAQTLCQHARFLYNMKKEYTLAWQLFEKAVEADPLVHPPTEQTDAHFGWFAACGHSGLFCRVRCICAAGLRQSGESVPSLLRNCPCACESSRVRRLLLLDHIQESENDLTCRGYARFLATVRGRFEEAEVFKCIKHALC